ncbi:MAG: LysM peptidoglycan-binding domain-containing protein [Gracilibacteraceae bacterium]|jgi:type IV pilus assembly protein PilQ|nr:LysM peptidoglycan-binding domain-containing protein [Gracilibacteraceae bacterium]
MLRIAESGKKVLVGMIVLIFWGLAFCAPPVFASGVSAAGETDYDVGEAEYVVRAGDTLEGIARQYGVDLNELAELNGITDRSLINAGQTLKIPGKEPVSPETEAPGVPSASWESSSISVDVREVDIRDVLSALAMSTGTNIVYKGGSAQVSLRMENVTPLAVLDYVTRLANMTYQRRGATIIVASRGDMRNYFYEQEAVTNFKLSYLTGAEVSERIKEGFLPSSVTLLYRERGGVGGRNLWAKGLPEELAQMRQIIDLLDTSELLSGGSDAVPDHLRFIQLSYLNASEFSAILASLGYSPGLVMQDDSMNLLYVGEDEDFAVVARIQEIVDVKQTSTTVKRVIDFSTDPDEGYKRLQIRRDLICEMTGISPSRFYISSNIAKSGDGTRYIMYLRGTPEEAAEVERVVSEIGG